MKRTWSFLAALSLACLSLTACPGGGAGPNDDGGAAADGGADGGRTDAGACTADPPQVVDFAVPPTGVVPQAGDIGTACTKTTDCTQGKTPTCWTAKPFNNANIDAAYQLAGGYCSSVCTQDADCGLNNLCIDFGTLGKACIAGCADAVTCRHPGYSCTVMSTAMDGSELFGCFPNGLLSCNPKMTSCTDLRYGLPGACYRQALEDDHGGVCYPTCNVGDPCDPDVFDETTQCLYLDFTDNGDAFRGTMCFPAAPTPKAEGTTCQFTDDCEDGLQCDNGLGGSMKCQQLCNLKGRSPKCAKDKVCTKAFSSCEAGLCQ